jgi:tRNA threonylcarbamoyladenosine biosynthesis protein TsaE
MTQTADLKVHQFASHSGKETIEIGHRIAELLVPPKFLILRGDLGAGKTTLVKGIAEALDAAEPDEVTSPTFTLIHEYEGTRNAGGHKEPVILYHLDLYRIQNERQLDSLGLDDLVGPDSLVLVW